MRPGARHHERIAVGRRFGRKLGRNRPAGAGPILDDDRLSERNVQFLADDARGDIGAAAGRRGDYHADRLGRILRGGLRRRGKRNEQSEQQKDRHVRVRTNSKSDDTGKRIALPHAD